MQRIRIERSRVEVQEGFRHTVATVYRRILRDNNRITRVLLTFIRHWRPAAVVHMHICRVICRMNRQVQHIRRVHRVRQYGWNNLLVDIRTAVFVTTPSITVSGTYLCHFRENGARLNYRQ